MPVDALESVDPYGRLAQVLRVRARRTEARREPVGVVRLVVEDEHPPGRGQVGEDAAAEGGVGFAAALDDGALRVLLRAPGLPVRHLDLHLPEQPGELRRDQVELHVQRLWVLRVQAPAPASRSLTVRFGATTRIWSENRVSCRLAILFRPGPCDDERHHHGLAGPGRHLHCPPGVRLTGAGDVDADFQVVGCLGEEHDRLDRFLLAEERPGRACYPAVVEPVPEQVAGHGGYAGIAVCSPLPDPVAQVVDEFERDHLVGDLQLAVRRRREVPGSPPPVADLRGDAIRSASSGSAQRTRR